MSIYSQCGQNKRLETDTKGKIIINRDGDIYKKKQKKLTRGQHTVLNLILKYMTTNTNHIIIDGETLDRFVEESGLSADSIKSEASRLTKHHIIEYIGSRTQTKGEYIVNPTYATKGNILKIWQFYQAVEYKPRGYDEVPVDVLSTADDIKDK